MSISLTPLQIGDIFIIINPLLSISQNYHDQLRSLTIEGSLEDRATHHVVKDFVIAIEDSIFKDYLTVKIDNTETKLKTIDEDLEDSDESSSWFINLVKPDILNTEVPFEGILFFMDSKSVEDFLERTSPLDGNSIFHKTEFIKILVNEDINSVFGAQIAICKIEDSHAKYGSNFNNLPNFGKTHKKVRIQSPDNIVIDPKKFAFDEYTKPYQALSRHFYLSLSMSIVSASINRDNISLQGVVHKEILATNGDELLSQTAIDDLVSVVEWIYEGNFSTRQRLFIDGLLLELKEEKTLVNLLLKHCKSSLRQSIDQFQFVIEERREQYFKELQGVLTEVRKQSDLYFDKLRNLATALSRDVLATMFLFGISLLTRLNDLISDELSNSASYFFLSIGSYLIGSWILQSILIWTDIKGSRNHFERWLENTMIYVSKISREELTQKPMRKNYVIFVCLYWFISIIYLTAGVTAIYFRKDIIGII